MPIISFMGVGQSAETDYIPFKESLICEIEPLEGHKGVAKHTFSDKISVVPLGN